MICAQGGRIGRPGTDDPGCDVGYRSTQYIIFRQFTDCMEYEIIRLSNGMRAVFQYQNLPITHVCMVINAGSRDELPESLVSRISLNTCYLKGRRNARHNKLLIVWNLWGVT